MECPVYLWLSKHRPDLIPENTLETERRFKIGREVDLFSRQLFPGGIEIEGFNREGWQNTKKQMAGSAKVLFQPTAVADQLTCRADILTRNNKVGGWDINEVKMAASVKEDHIYDVSFQRICFENADIRIGRTRLVHINREYVRHGEIEPEKLFVAEDITKEVENKLPEVKEEIKHALEVVGWRKELDAWLLASCGNPRICEFIQYYCEGIRGVPLIASGLPIKHLLWLLNRGILKPKDFSKELLASIGFEPEVPFTHIDAPAIQKELTRLRYPLYFLDYETYGHIVPIPPFDGYRPYQNMPFQYSLMVKKSPTESVKSMSFLARTFSDPVQELVERLQKDLGPKGTIIVWNESFEKGCNEDMGKVHPQYAKFLASLNKRIFDLMLIFKHNRKLYTKSEFHGSASLKNVLPVLCPELSYTSLAIQEGGEASASWPVLTKGDISKFEKDKLASDMLTYCKRDTEAMVCILEQLERDISK
jgi:hypothetical protein